MIPTNRITPKLLERLRKIKALLLDVDGVLTDSQSVVSTKNSDTKALYKEDISLIQYARDNGVHFGIITGRFAGSTEDIAATLGVTDVYYGYLQKLDAFTEFKDVYEYTNEELAYIGDDIFDLPVIKEAGLGVAPANAHAQVRVAAEYVCKARGGKGAVAEILSLILHARHDGSAE